MYYQILMTQKHNIFKKNYLDSECEYGNMHTKINIFEMNAWKKCFVVNNFGFYGRINWHSWKKNNLYD